MGKHKNVKKEMEIEVDEVVQVESRLKLGFKARKREIVSEYRVGEFNLRNFLNALTRDETRELCKMIGSKIGKNKSESIKGLIDSGKIKSAILIIEDE